MSELAKHVWSDTAPHHRLKLLDPSRIRCLDCSETILITAAGSPPRSTSTSRIPAPIHHQDACPLHLGEWAATCSPCRAERIAHDGTTRLDLGPRGADPHDCQAWTELRAQLAQANTDDQAPAEASR
jgi:hypothetical protein